MLPIAYTNHPGKWCWKVSSYDRAVNTRTPSISSRAPHDQYSPFSTAPPVMISGKQDVKKEPWKCAEAYGASLKCAYLLGCSLGLCKSSSPRFRWQCGSSTAPQFAHDKTWTLNTSDVSMPNNDCVYDMYNIMSWQLWPYCFSKLLSCEDRKYWEPRHAV